MLRIDDLDRERYRTTYGTDVFETLRFLNVQWNEGPQRLEDVEKTWSQRHRMPLYNAALERLKISKAVFACTCSRTQSGDCTCEQRNLSLDAPNASWRLRTTEEPIGVQTIDDKIINASLPSEMKNFVVRRKDGLPAYQLASVVDDLHFGIDLIVRGEDLWPSTLAQLYLAKQLGEVNFSAVAFYHHALLKNERGEKLSKSAGDTSIKHWREEGKTLKQFLAQLGKCLNVTVENKDDLLKAFFV